jgi:hypothetical protein
LGSDVSYQSYRIKGLNYWQLPDKFTLALRLQYDGVSADNANTLPNYVLPGVDLRGISATRYQGQVVRASTGWTRTCRT